MIQGGRMSNLFINYVPIQRQACKKCVQVRNKSTGVYVVLTHSSHWARHLESYCALHCGQCERGDVAAAGQVHQRQQPLPYPSHRWTSISISIKYWVP